MKPKAKGSSAVMAQRRELLDSLDDFPTPPWATRALCEVVLDQSRLANKTFWEPAANRGLMAKVLQEYFWAGFASDVHDYGVGYPVGSFTGVGPDRIEWPDLATKPHWIITNPPFNAALEFVLRALEEAANGVAMLCRSNWAEGAERYWDLFKHCPPAIEALFVERVPMVKGRWDPDASTATAYSWFIWDFSQPVDFTRKFWIPPGQRQALERRDDRRRFAAIKTDANQGRLI